MLRQEDILIEKGRCEGGGFIRLVHTPSAISRSMAPIRGIKEYNLIQAWLGEIEAELLERGLMEFIVPAFRT